MKIFLKIVTIFIAIGAVGGAVMMWMDPTGVSWGGEPMLDLLRAKMPWPEIFFKDFIPSGYVLLAVNGLPQILAAVMLFKNRPYAYWACFICGIILMLWIVLEWYVWVLWPSVTYSLCWDWQKVPLLIIVYGKKSGLQV